MEQLSVVIIDDDPVSHFICKKIIQRCDPGCDITSFFNPEIAVDYFNIHQHDEQLLPDIIFLDLNMPQLDGWQVLDRFSVLDFKKDIHIHILTSSVTSEEKDRAGNYPLVKGFESKPLSAERFREIKEGVLNGK